MVAVILAVSVLIGFVCGLVGGFVCGYFFADDTAALRGLERDHWWE